jgi:hypothetical protein
VGRKIEIKEEEVKDSSFLLLLFLCYEEEDLGRTSRERWGGGNVGRGWRERRMS